MYYSSMYVYSCKYRHMCIGGQWSMSVPSSTVPHHFFVVVVETGSLTEPRVYCFWVASLLYLHLGVGTTNTLHCAWLWLWVKKIKLVLAQQILYWLSLFSSPRQLGFNSSYSRNLASYIVHFTFHNAWLFCPLSQA